MADKFLESKGVEVGYFARRRDQFNRELQKGLDSALNTGGNKKTTTRKKATKKKAEKKDPRELRGQEFVDRMKALRDAKGKEVAENEENSK